SLFWLSVIPLGLYFILVIFWGVLLSEFSRREFKYSLLRQFCNLVSLCIAGIIIVNTVPQYDISSPVVVFFLVFAGMLIIRRFFFLLMGSYGI
ncbi:MAG: hypothetical protein ACOC5A_05130, partial [Halanaerobiales bacterium]